MTRFGTYKSSFSSPLWMWQQGNSFIQTETELFRCRFQSTFCTGLFAMTFVFLHVLLKWKYYPHTLVLQPVGVGSWPGFKFSAFFSKQFSDECSTDGDAGSKLFFKSPEFFSIRVAISFIYSSLSVHYGIQSFTWLLSRMCQHVWKIVLELQLCFAIILPKMFYIVVVLKNCLAASAFKNWRDVNCLKMCLSIATILGTSMALLSVAHFSGVLLPFFVCLFLAWCLFILNLCAETLLYATSDTVSEKELD